MSNKELGFDTRAIHSGGDKKEAHGALNPPIYQTSTFVFDSVAEAEDTFSFRSDGYVYTRGRNPTLTVFEERMAALEEGVAAVSFASGMAAITSVLLSFLRQGDEVVAHRTLYGSSYNVLANILPDYGISTHFVDLTEPARLAAAINDKTRVVYFETPSNPDLSLVDITAIAQIAHAAGAKVVVDNTIATPYFQRPLALGADVVVHSATKYISGHGDVVAGVAVSNDPDYTHRLRFGYMAEFGGVLAPFNAWLLVRGLKTLGLRMRQHEANARQVAAYLARHPAVTQVLYPGLPDFPQHDLADRQMSGYGAIVSFEVRGGERAAKAVIDRVRLVTLAVSLGDAETLIEHPVTMTHRGFPREDLARYGLSPGLIRLSIGLENAEDIIADLEQALAGM